jgi:hypothetical protein
MFEKLTPRERVLVYAVGLLVPIALVAGVGLWFFNSLSQNDTDRAALITNIGDAEYEMALGKKADLRRAYYESISLPADIEGASNNYLAWMKGLVRDDLKMKLKMLTPSDSSPLKYGTTVVGKRKSYTLAMDGTLDDLTKFLSCFYKVDLLHRLNTLKITPQNETAGSKRKIRTGILSIVAKIEVLSLSSSVLGDDFIEQLRRESETEDDWTKKLDAMASIVEHRDIFGPPNNEPTVSAKPARSYTSMKDITVSLSGKDADTDDMLKFEFAGDLPIDDMEIDAKEGSRSAKLIIPGQEAGTYSFDVIVSDNGFPAKSTTETVRVVFKDDEPRVVKPVEKPAPAFLNAKETRITAIVRDRSGDWQVWINVRTTGERFKLKEGDSFDLDKKKWFVVEIRPDDVVFRVDNNQLTVEPADVFFSVDQIPQGPPADEVGTQKPESEVEADESLKSDVS